MKTKTPPASPAPVKPTRRPKAAPPAQMSLLDLEPQDVPAPVRVPRAPATPRPKKAETVVAPPPQKTPAVAAAPTSKAVRTPKPPAPNAAKSVPVKTGKKPARPEPVRIVPETLLTSGAVWKMSGKNGVAYVQDAALAGELLATDPKNLAKRAMAVYYDKKGRAFAWQVRFDTDRWDEVMKRLA